MNGKPRVMYLVRAYPAVSETYISAEIDALRDDYEIAIVASAHAHAPRANHHPYHVASSLEEVREVAEDFRPHVLHAHWLQLTETVARAASMLGVPFTIRSHSHDVQWGGVRGWLFDRSPKPARSFMPRHLHQARSLLGDDACLGVICFPFARRRLLKSGIPGEKLHDCYPVVDIGRFLDRSPNGPAVMGVGTARENKQFEHFLDVARRVPNREFHLYATPGPRSEDLARQARPIGDRFRMMPTIQPEDMPAQYKGHEWLLYTASRRLRTVGWPVALAEAQASGVGVCMAALRPDLRDYVGAAGFLYDSPADAERVVSQPFSAELRELGFQQAKKSDIQVHKRILTSLWEPAITRR